MEEWNPLERNIIRQKGKHFIQDCEWNIDKTMTPYKTNTHQKHQQLKSPIPCKTPPNRGIYWVILKPTN